MVSVNQIAGFLSLNISKNIYVIKLVFYACKLKLQMDDVMLGGHGQACLDMLKWGY